MISNKSLGNHQQQSPDFIDQLRDYISKMGIITKVIFCVNACVFILQSLIKISALEYASWLEPITHGQFYRIITAIFSHANLVHFFFNMISLVMFSPSIEDHHRTVDYLIINVFLYNVVGKWEQFNQFRTCIVVHVLAHDICARNFLWRK